MLDLLAALPDWIGQVFGPLAAAGAVYGGIRSDLRHAVRATEKAHARMDEHMRDHMTGDFCPRFREGDRP